MVSKKFLQRKEFLFSLAVIATIMLDQLTKYLVLKFQPNWNLKILTIQLIKNTGAGFGILKDNAFLLGFVSLIVAILIIIYYKKIPEKKFPQIVFALFLGGVIGNMLDRFVLGYVIDFINFSFWPAFNVADSALTIAVIGIILWYLQESN